MNALWFYSEIEESEEIYNALKRYFEHVGHFKLEKTPTLSLSEIYERRDESRIIVYAPDVETLQNTPIINTLTNLGIPVVPLVLSKSATPSCRFRVWEPYDVRELRRLMENLEFHKRPAPGHYTYPWPLPSINIPDWWTWDALIVDDEIEFHKKDSVDIKMPSFYTLLIKLLLNGQILPLSKGSINIYVSNFEEIEGKKIYKINKEIPKNNQSNKYCIKGISVPFNHETISNMDVIFVDLLEEEKFKGLKWIKEFEHIKKISGFPFVIALSQLSRYQGQFISASEDVDYFLSKEDIISARGPSLLEIMWYHLQKKNELLLKVLDRDKSDKKIEVKNLQKNGEHIKNLLKLLYYSRYPDVKEIFVIKSSSKGKSGAGVYFVNVMIGDHDHITPTRVVKIDRLDNISFERYNFHKHISPHIESFTAVPSYNLAKIIIGENILAAHEYTAVGSWKDYFGEGIVDFEEFLLKYPDKEKVKEKTYQLFSLILSPLHRSRIDLKRIEEEYGEYYKIRLNSLLNFFEVFLRFKGREINKEARETGFKEFQVYSGESEETEEKMRVKLFQKVQVEKKERIQLYTSQLEPFLFLRRGKIIKLNVEKKNDNEKDGYVLNLGPCCELFLNHELDELKKPPKLSLIHGDLHPRNILYSRSTDYLWLIDFFNSGPGVLAFDFAEFEVNTRWFVICEIIKKLSAKHDKLLTYFNELEECIMNFRNPETLSFINELKEPDKQSLISSVIAIQTAEEYAFTHYFPTEVERREYWTACGLFALCNLRRALKQNENVKAIMMKHLVYFIQQYRNIPLIKSG